MALAAGQKFAAGTRQFAVVTFTTQANASLGMTHLDFDDLPAAREVSDANANALPASYEGGSISIVNGFEGDIGLAMALPTGEILPVGAREIVVISFTPLSRRSALTRAVEFADYPVRRELVDSRANVAPAAFAVEQHK